MTAVALLALVEEYGQAVGRGDGRHRELLAQIGAALTGLAKERDRWRAAFDGLLVQHAQMRGLSTRVVLRDPKVCLDHNTPMVAMPDMGPGHWGCPVDGCLSHFYLPDATKEH